MYWPPSHGFATLCRHSEGRKKPKPVAVWMVPLAGPVPVAFGNCHTWLPNRSMPNMLSKLGSWMQGAPTIDSAQLNHVGASAQRPFAAFTSWPLAALAAPAPTVESGTNAVLDHHICPHQELSTTAPPPR